MPQVPTWQVAATGPSLGLPNVEVEASQLRSLERNALVWTDGLDDWLPLGELPPPEQLLALPSTKPDSNSPSPSKRASRSASPVPAAMERSASTRTGIAMSISAPVSSATREQYGRRIDKELARRA